MAKKIKWSPLAIRKFDEILEYWTNRNKSESFSENEDLNAEVDEWLKDNYELKTDDRKPCRRYGILVEGDT